MQSITAEYNQTAPTQNTTLFWRIRMGKTGFQIEGSDLIQLITEDRLRHTSGPVQSHASVTYISKTSLVITFSFTYQDSVRSHQKVFYAISFRLGLPGAWHKIDDHKFPFFKFIPTDL